MDQKNLHVPITDLATPAVASPDALRRRRQAAGLAGSDYDAVTAEQRDRQAEETQADEWK